MQLLEKVVYTPAGKTQTHPKLCLYSGTAVFNLRVVSKNNVQGYNPTHMRDGPLYNLWSNYVGPLSTFNLFRWNVIPEDSPEVIHL